jgi:arginyl-tRNA synthetase
VSLGPEHIRPESFYNPMLGDVVEELEKKDLTTESEGALCVFLDAFKGKDGEPQPLIVRKSGGGYLYATTDLAALQYRARELGAQRIIYVTDARQRQHFAMVFRAAELAGWLEGGGRPEHVCFGTILGEDGKPFKARSGESVRLADLLDDAESRASAIVAEKNPDLDEEQRAEVARAVGVGAIKYGDLSSDRVKDYVFSWQRMLAMDGNTAPYLQYAYTRIRSIFRKAGEAADPEATVIIEHPAERALILKLAQLGPTVRSVAEHLEPHRLCTWLYELATAFSAFYENCPVLQGDERQRASRLLLCDLTARALRLGLDDLLGIPVMERM